MEESNLGCVNCPCFYLVRTKGYSAQFSKLAEAEKAFNKEKNKKIKAEETFKIELLTKATKSDRWEVIDQVKIGVDYYEETKSGFFS